MLLDCLMLMLQTRAHSASSLLYVRLIQDDAIGQTNPEQKISMSKELSFFRKYTRLQLKKSLDIF